MNIEIRIYKRFDTDLLALHDAGYSISKMMEEALIAYANGQPCHFLLDEVVPFDMNDKKNIRVRLKIPNTEQNVAILMKNIKHSYRSNFCKQVLRNAMIRQNLFCYFSGTDMLPLHEANVRTCNPLAFQGIRKCSDYRQMTRTVKFLGNNITLHQQQAHTIQLSHDTAEFHQSGQKQSRTKTAKPITTQQSIPTNEVPKAQPFVPNIKESLHVPPAVVESKSLMPNDETPLINADEKNTARNNASIMKMFENL